MPMTAATHSVCYPGAESSTETMNLKYLARVDDTHLGSTGKALCCCRVLSNSLATLAQRYVAAVIVDCIYHVPKDHTTKTELSKISNKTDQSSTADVLCCNVLFSQLHLFLLLPGVWLLLSSSSSSKTFRLRAMVYCVFPLLPFPMSGWILDEVRRRKPAVSATLELKSCMHSMLYALGCPEVTA